ncbi:MAG: DUF2807 domain-containing protein [Clostridium sp.]|nr:DUF2807 domain-containing protein [Clostridium sp.]
MKTRILFSALVAVLFGIQGTCCNGAEKQAPETREYPATDFYELSTGVSIEVIYTQVPTPSIKVEATPLGFDRLIVKNRNGKLSFSLRKGKNQFGKIRAYVSSTSLRDVEIDTSGSVRIEGTLNCADELEVEVETSGCFDAEEIVAPVVDLNAETSGSINIVNFRGSLLKAEAETSGSINVKGQAERAKLEAETSGSIDIRQMKVTDVDAKATVGGLIRIPQGTTGRIIERIGGSVR